MLSKRKRTLMMKVFVVFLSFAFVSTGFAARIVPTGTVSIIKDGTPEEIRASVISCYKQTKGRGIVSAGCEVPAETSYENIMEYMKVAHEVMSL